MEKIELPRPAGQKVLYFDCLDSTSDYLRELIRLKKARPGTVIWAEEQKAGRGRRGRSWFSPRGGLYFSVFMDKKESINPAFSLVVGASVIRGVHSLCRVSLSLKWPNDIFFRGKKAGGILSEVFSGSLLIGIGLNLRPVDQYKAELGSPAAHLVLPAAISRERLLGVILENLYRDWQVFRGSGFAPFLPEQRQLSYLHGKKVAVEGKKGRVTDFGDGGELIILTREGAVEKIYQGSVTVLEEE